MEGQTSSPPVPEIWQVEAGGEIYQGNIEELAQWIAEGALLPQDKVKRGNLRWIEANKVPSLHRFFNARELGAIPPLVTSSPFPQIPKTVSIPNQADLNQANFCLVHTETGAKYICEACANFFCQECPTSFGGTVKICPMCGAMCKSLEKVIEATNKSVGYYQAVTEGFGISDFARAFAYPFKYPASFVFGALFYVFFSIGQQASAIGGIWLLAGSIFCWMMANMLTFGILSNTVENMLQGRLNENFMPSFDNFSLWDDVVHPLFLSISIYLVSFGALIILVVGLFFYAANSLKKDSLQTQKAVQTVAPEASADFGAAQQGPQQINGVKEAIKLQNERNQERMRVVQERKASDEAFIESVENGEISQNSPGQEYVAPVLDEEKEFQKMNEMINKTRQQQLESAIGKPEEEPFVLQNLSQEVFKWAGSIILLAGITFLWGVFYLPVASIVAAYTRNIGSVFNLSIGFDTIKRLGGDYLKILLMGFFLWVLGAVFGSLLSLILLPFNLPRLGNIPAIAIGSVFGFYLSIVFSVTLGYALFKNSNKFSLFQTN